MYIRSNRMPVSSTFAEFPSRAGTAVKPLRFLTLDEFPYKQHSLTPRLIGLIEHLANHVISSWNTNQRITVIRLVGHTDWIGDAKDNAQLGDKRAETIKAALQQRLKSFMDRVLIVVDPSPGETEPIADNRTSEGRSKNRRVEVFVTFEPAPPPPEEICIDPRRCVKPPETSVIVTKRPPWVIDIPAGPRPKSIQQRVEEKLKSLPKWLSWPIKKAVIEGSCMGLEIALGKVVGRLSESEKEELRRQCSERAKKPFGHFGFGAFSAPPSAEERIREDQFPRVLKILTGPSPWQGMIQRNLSQIKVTANTFRVVDRKEYGRVLQELDLEDTGHIAGVTNKKTGIITMLEWFGGSSQATFLGAALHEAVHLVSHPPGGSKLGRSSAGSQLGPGLLEGLVEHVSVTILLRQGFTPVRPKWGGHANRVPVAEALVKAMGPIRPGELLFAGIFRNFLKVMIDVFTPGVWHDIKTLTTADKAPETQRALALIKAKEQQLRNHPLVLPPKPVQVIFR